MGHGTQNNSEPVPLYMGQAEGGVAISRFRGNPEKRHETCQFRISSQALGLGKITISGISYRPGTQKNSKLPPSKTASWRNVTLLIVSFIQSLGLREIPTETWKNSDRSVQVMSLSPPFRLWDLEKFRASPSIPWDLRKFRTPSQPLRKILNTRCELSLFCLIHIGSGI